MRRLLSPNLIFFLSKIYFSGLIYNRNYKDILHVIQNGSLLRIDESFESYDVYDHYCLEFDDEEGALTAIVCEFDDMLFRVNRAQALIFATCMIISVPVRNQLIKIIVDSTHDADWEAGGLAGWGTKRGV